MNTNGKFDKLDELLDKIGTLVDRLAPVDEQPVNVNDNLAFRWERTGDTGRLIAVTHPHLFDLGELVGIDDIRDEVIRNTRQFVESLPAITFCSGESAAAANPRWSKVC